MTDHTESLDFDARTEAPVSLRYPVTVQGTTYDTLTMRRPKTKDSLAVAKKPGSDADRGILLFARLCDVSPDVIAELDEIDTDKLGKQLEAFRPRQA